RAGARGRGSGGAGGVAGTVPVPCAWGAFGGVGGLVLWHPYGAWPEWYTFLWLPALVGVIVPAPRRWAVAGIATVAGTAAALVTWGAAVEGRLQLARRDAQSLGTEGDAVAVALLERVGEEARTAPPPHSAGDLYALWLRSPLAAQDYPTVLALWSHAAGAPVAEIRLATLDLPSDTLAALVRSPQSAAGPRVERLERVPGVRYVLLGPLASGDLLTVGVGPRSRYMAPDRVAQFLRGDLGRAPPYSITLGGAEPGMVDMGSDVSWTREGWFARGERHLSLPGGARHVHVRVELGPPRRGSPPGRGPAHSSDAARRGPDGGAGARRRVRRPARCGPLDLPRGAAGRGERSGLGRAGARGPATRPPRLPAAGARGCARSDHQRARRWPSGAGRVPRRGARPPGRVWHPRGSAAARRRAG